MALPGQKDSVLSQKGTRGKVTIPAKTFAVFRTAVTTKSIPQKHCTGF